VAHHTYPSELTPSLSALPRARLLVTMPVAPHLLNDEELAVLRTYGSEEVAAAQSVLFAAGEAAYDLIVVLEGHAQIAEDDWQQRVGATFGPSEFLGELDLLTGKRVSLTGKMLTDGRILRLPVAQLRRVMANELVLN
jgi:thioredoxin reductase (NADPH)